MNERMRGKEEAEEATERKRERNLEEREIINIISSCSNILFKKFNS